MALAILGAVTGVVGTGLGVWSYRRDTARIKVAIKWDMSTVPPQQNDGKVGVLRIENVGRRPVYVSHAYVRAGNSNTDLLLKKTIDGYQIFEGGKPIVIKVPQNGLEEFAKDWQSVCVVVRGNNGTEYVSNFPENKPSWAS